MLQPGAVLQDRYQIVALLGRGGMGAVYRAHDTRLNVVVAVKEMVAQPGLDDEALSQLHQQFHEEATIVARLRHPNLVSVTDFFEQDGNVYLVMTFVEGESLAARIGKRGALPEAEVVALAGQLLDALAYCHDQGILHRDIKPQNVIIRPDGRPVLVDFGLVKLWNPGDPRTRTAMRGMGTPEYAPPEQYEAAAGHTDLRSDIYSLGATLYHALTGQAPPTATLRVASPASFKQPRALNPSISPHIEAVIMRATELPLERRFVSAREMAAALAGTVPVYAVAGATALRVPQAVQRPAVAHGTGTGPVAGVRTPSPTGRPPATGPTGAGPSGSLTQPAAARSRPGLWAGVGLGGGVLLALCIVVALAFAFWPDLRARFSAAGSRQPTGAPEETTPPATGGPVVLGNTPAPVTPESVEPTDTPGVTPSPKVGVTPTDTATPESAPEPEAGAEPQRIAFVRGDVGKTDIYIINPDGSDERCVACRPCDEAEPAWSHDGRVIAFQSDCDGSYDIWTAGVDGGDAVRLTSGAVDEREPDWSPDGTQIVFRANPKGKDRNSDGDLQIMAADGSDIYSLGVSGRAPVWSPDGGRIAFMSERDGSWEVYVYNLGSGATDRLTTCDDAECRFPDWSPDGGGVIYHNTTGPGSVDAEAIWVLPLEGGGGRKLVGGQSSGRAAWCATGIIVFNSDRGLEVVQADGSGRRTLVSGDQNWAPACP